MMEIDSENNMIMTIVESEEQSKNIHELLRDLNKTNTAANVDQHIINVAICPQNTAIEQENVSVDIEDVNNLKETGTESTVKQHTTEVNIMFSEDCTTVTFTDIEKSKEIRELEADSHKNDVDSPIKKPRSRLQALIDSDTSEDEAEAMREDVNEDEDISEFAGRKIEDSPDKETSDYTKMKSRLKALCDSESSDDEKEPAIKNYEIVAEKHEWLSKPKNKAKKSEKVKDKKMTPKEYEEQKLEIKSESQRMQRERNVSLPYHRPKPRSLKEFLEMRPRFTAALANKEAKTPPILAIKMTNQNLENISKKLEEREKMLEEFYKSESESEEEEFNEDLMKVDANKTKNEAENEQKDELANEENISARAENNENFPQTNNENNIIDKVELENNVLEKNLPEFGANTTKEIPIETITTKNSDDKRSSIEIISNILIPENSEDTSLNNESAEFEFSLDNVELSENINDSLINQTEEVKDESDSPPSDSLPKKKLNRLQLLKEALVNSKPPKLSGDPNDLINLDEDVADEVKGTSGVDRLIERFIKHSTRKVQPKDDSVQVDVMTLSGGELRKEVLTMELHSDSADEPIAVLETPGAKLKKLRSALQSQMALRRSEIWKQKQKELLENAPTGEEGKEGYEDGDEYDILDDEEEDFDVEEEEEEDEELVEDNVDMSEKKRGKKSLYVDDEAELSESENTVAADNDDDDDDDENEEQNAEDNSEQEAKKEDDAQTSSKKKLKRIITMDDSDDDDESNVSIQSVVTPKANRVTCIGPLDSTDPWEDDDDDDYALYPNAQRPPSRQRTPQLTRTKSTNTLGFITPVRQLTALQSLQSFSSSMNEEHDAETQTKQEKGGVGEMPLMPDPSPLRGDGWHRHLLFPDCDLNGASTVNMEELANEICSGKFPSSLSAQASPNEVVSNLIKPLFNNMSCTQQSEPSTQDVLDICSGNFTSTTQISNYNREKLISNDEEAISNTSGTQDRASSVILNNLEKLLNEDVFKFPTLESLDDDDDKIISQLLDEEEMEMFKKKFESPVNVPEKSEIPPNSPICSRFMFDTSDEDDEDKENTEGIAKVLRKKRTRKHLIEDSEDEEQENKSEDVESVDFDDEDNETCEGNNDENAVDYDSEENEVDGTVVLESKSALRVKDFLENEAELSESDWDSADEDEKGLDELEIEAGDEEKFDEQKLRTGIERVQLRQMLDEDNKDLKLLQEMLLEDGELHGTGRERQFKWRNVDNKFDLESGERNENDEGYLDDAADSEEIWRKKRHERVLFLQKTKESQKMENDDIILSSNNILKLGRKAIVRNASNSQTVTGEIHAQQEQISLTVKQPFTLLNKRGSFLTRGEKVLAKVAEFTKTTEKISSKGPTKFSRNFLFSTVLNKTDSDDNPRKRKADDSTPTAIKRLRLHNLSPTINRISGKTSAKKLFSNT